MMDRLDPVDFTERLWLEDRAVEPECPESDELLGRYEADGHLVVLYRLPDRALPAERWFATCSCGAAVWGDDDLTERRLARGRTPGRLVTYLDVKWWGLEHRADAGCDPQDWWPWRDWSPWACRSTA